jgi:hypothetical protein
MDRDEMGVGPEGGAGRPGRSSAELPVYANGGGLYARADSRAPQMSLHRRRHQGRGRPRRRRLLKSRGGNSAPRPFASRFCAITLRPFHPDAVPRIPPDRSRPPFESEREDVTSPKEMLSVSSKAPQELTQVPEDSAGPPDVEDDSSPSTVRMDLECSRKSTVYPNGSSLQPNRLV